MSYGIAVVKLKEWRRKLVEIACEYTASYNPRYHRVRLDPTGIVCINGGHIIKTF